MQSQSKSKFYSLAEISASFKKGDIKPSEVLEYYLKQIEEKDPHTQAFESKYLDSALASGKSADLAMTSGNLIGPFHGVPFVLKDICELKGHVTTGGSKVFRNRVSNTTAKTAKRLLAAGGILLGKSKTVEFAFGGWGTNQKMGTPKNPWDSTDHRVCGGSSAGSAAAIAADMAICGIGTDTGGSVRLPAAFCGLTGLKVTKGLLSTDGILPLSHTLDTPGPMARSLLDMVIMLEVLIGTEGWKIDKKIKGEKGYFKNLIGNVSGLRIGIINERDRQECDFEVLDHYDKALRILEEQGAILDTYNPPVEYSTISTKVGNIIAVEAYYHHGQLYEDMEKPMDEDVRERVLKVRNFSANDYLSLLEERKDAERLFSRSMTKFDAIVTPTIVNEAPLLCDVDQAVSPGYFTRPFNYAGMCALSLPIGLSKNGLPLSFQIAGRPNNEGMTLQVGAAIERGISSIF